MLVVPLQATPSQVVTITLADQACKISVRQLRTGLFLDLSVNDAPIVVGAVAQHANRIVRDEYLGFTGDLAFFDTQGVQDPYYAALGVRYVLMYLEAADL